MKTNPILTLTTIILMMGFFPVEKAFSQSKQGIVKKYMQELPHGKPDFSHGPEKYRMTAVYINRDLYGNFTGKTKISGDYTCGYGDGTVMWNNVSISESNDFSGLFPEGKRQEYMEGFRYTPSEKILDPGSYSSFPPNPQSVLARNLAWDMFMIEQFAWDHSDSLKLNKEYKLSDEAGSFEMSDIGNYEHSSIYLTWTGISFMNNQLCGVIEYRATDNKVNLDMDMISTRGTEEYWGTTWVSLATGEIEFAETYSGTFQEITIKGMKDKLLVRTIRDLKVERIK